MSLCKQPHSSHIADPWLSVPQISQRRPLAQCTTGLTSPTPGSVYHRNTTPTPGSVYHRSHIADPWLSVPQKHNADPWLSVPQEHNADPWLSVPQEHNADHKLSVPQVSQRRPLAHCTTGLTTPTPGSVYHRSHNADPWLSVPQVSQRRPLTPGKARSPTGSTASSPSPRVVGIRGGPSGYSNTSSTPAARQKDVQRYCIASSDIVTRSVTYS